MNSRTDYYIISETGSRSYNEDSAVQKACGEREVFAVADGLGGCGAGDIASSAAVRTVVETFEKQTSINSEELLEKVFYSAQDKVLSLQKTEKAHHEMASTLTVLLLEGGSAQWAHIGDTRLYMFRNGEVLYQTKDHSVPQMLVNMGEMEPEEIRYHPDRSRLLSVVGRQWNGKVFSVSPKVRIKKGDAFLLCSDGFWELIEEKQMCSKLLETSNAAHWVEKMKSVVLKNGRGKNMDNLTALAVRI